MPCVGQFKFLRAQNFFSASAFLSFPPSNAAGVERRRGEEENVRRLQRALHAGWWAENVIAKWKMCFLRTMRDERESANLAEAAEIIAKWFTRKR
jgi:hypothetical protein